MVSIVLHPDVIKFLRTDIDSGFHQKTWHCIDQLRKQQFSGGLRVKRLKGITKRVWEARINRASRLIFTYNKSRQTQTGKEEIYIAIQDICIDHDDVPRKAIRERTPDAVWLDTEVINILGNTESDLTQLPQTERDSLEFAQLEDQDLDLAISSEDNADELLGNIQWLVIDSPEDWQRAIIKQDVDLQLKLTPEEYALAIRPGDILLKGSAGTGKTTVAVHRLLYDYLQYPTAGQRLYVAYNPLLVNNVKEQFYKLLGNNNPAVTSLFQFRTLRDLCLEILQQNEQSYLPEDEVNFYVFERIYLQKHNQRYPTALVWDEIRSIIKGGQLALDSDYLSLEDYKELGAKRSSVVPFDRRTNFYSQFVPWYQKKLKVDKRFDEIDLTRRALQIFNQNNLQKYRLIVCDEVQDFTELQLEFLMEIVAPKGNLFFAGDIHQMISPSGFRWGDLTTRFFQHERRKPIEETFTFNFRSVGTLVNLANQVLQLRYRLLNTSSPYQNVQAINTYGELARLVEASSQQLESVLKTLRPGDAILVRTNPEREHLRQVFESTLVFTIEEAKGLEFDTVFLVDFFQPNMELWQGALQTPPRLQENQIPGLSLELNLLYVALTRARRILNIWEESICEFWQQPELIDHYTIKDMQTVAENRFDAQVQDWQQRGEYYLKGEFYLQAAECFEKSGDRFKYLQARAKQLQREGQYQKAAVIFEKLKDWETAAKLFQRVQQWQAAAKCWEQGGNFKQKQICEIYLLEAQGKIAEAARQWDFIGRHHQAAELFEKVKEWQTAARCWEQAGNYEQKQICEIRLLEVKKQWQDAAQQWHLLKRLDDEKRCWMQSSNEPKKAEYRAKDFERQKQWLQASEQYELAGLPDKAIEIRRKGFGELMKSGQAQFERQNYQGALADYTRALELNPNDDEVYVQRGLVRNELKKYFAAIEDYNQALMINPEYVEVYEYREKVYQILSQNSSSLEGAAVLGGIEGVKLQLQNPDIKVRIAALEQAVNYGEQGLDLVIAGLKDKSWDIQNAAYLILNSRTEPRIKQLLQNPNQQGLKLEQIEVVTVNKSGRIIQRQPRIARYFIEDLGNGVKLEMAAIPGGTFMMGSPENEEGRMNRESPQHQVSVPSFFMGKYPVTQAQYQAIMGTNSSYFKGSNHPVERVSWNNAIAFCRKLSKRTGKNYRLPSETEWEYACRAGTTTPFHFGETITTDLANYNGNYTYGGGVQGTRRGETTEVGSFGVANNFGLYDMHGNVWEWCQDHWHDNYKDAPINGSVWISNKESSNEKLLRGGSWGSDPDDCRSAYRYYYNLDGSYPYNIGFRVVCSGAART